MKKFAKMSLAAAVAVAGLTSTASAVDLAEAIKGVDVSGHFRFRYQEVSTGDSGSDVEVEVTAKVPVNDNVSAIFKIDNAGDDSDTAGTPGGIDKDGIAIEDYYFQYVNGPVTVNAGQFNIPGRLTDGGQGNGLVALYNAGAFTVGAAAYDNVTVAGTTYNQMLTSIIAMGSVGPVSLLGQYVDMADLLDSYNLKADAKVGPVMAGLEYSRTELDNETANVNDDNETFVAYVSGKVDIVSAKLSYVKTGDTGSGSIAQELEAPSEFLLWNLGSNAKADMDLWAIDASVAVTDKISLRAAYADGEIGNGATSDVSEALGQISYKMSKNLNTYVRYSRFDNSSASDAKADRGRVEVRYTF